MYKRRILTEEELSRQYGRLTIISDGGQKIQVRCACGKETWKYKSAVLSHGVKSCGNDCALGRMPRGNRKPATAETKRRLSVGSSRAQAIRREFVSSKPDAAEREHVERIIASRTMDARFARELKREAIDIVVRDRQKGELICHGGTELI